MKALLITIFVALAATAADNCFWVCTEQIEEVWGHKIMVGDVFDNRPFVTVFDADSNRTKLYCRVDSLAGDSAMICLTELP